MALGQSGAVGILPQPTSGPGMPATWVDAGDKSGKKAQLPPKRRKKEKETTPAPAVRTVPSRVSATLILFLFSTTIVHCRPRSPSTSTKARSRTLHSLILMDYLPNHLPTIPRMRTSVCYLHFQCTIWCCKPPNQLHRRHTRRLRLKNSSSLTARSAHWKARRRMKSSSSS